MLKNASQKYVLGLSIFVLVATYMISYNNWQEFFAWKPILGLIIAVGTNVLNSINKGTIAEQTTSLVSEVKKEAAKNE